MSVKEKYAHLAPLPTDIAERLAQLPTVLLRHPVRLAYLFGSAAWEIRQSTDVDLAVLPDDGFSYAALYADLSLALNTDRLDVVDLRFVPSYLKVEIVTTGRCLWARSDEERLRFEGAVRMHWRDERYRLLSRPMAAQRGVREMGLKKEFIVHGLAELERVAQELEKYRGTTAEAMATNLSLRWTIERGLLAGLTLLFQIADHILSHHFQRTVSTYEGLLSELCACGIISEDLYRQLKGAGGFRNVLVHEYLDIDLNEVVRVLQRAPSLFYAFFQAVSAWLGTLPEE